METAELLRSARRYWRVPVVALLGALLAFGGSYLLSPSYVSKTKLLVRGRSTTVLSSQGKDLSSQPGVVDSNLAKALGDTQGALVGSRVVAEMVVKDLKLDTPRPKPHGIVKKVRAKFKTVYKVTRAWVTYGRYEEPPRHKAAVDAVFNSLSAAPLKDSYVLELSASSDDPRLSAAMADSGADALVKVSTDRFRQEATRYRDFLSKEVARAQTAVDQAHDAVENYKRDHNITDADLSVQLSTTSKEDLQNQLRDTSIKLDAARAQLGSIEASLAATAPTSSSQNSVQTGRSETNVDNTTPNPVYQQLLLAKQTAESDVASLDAQHAAILRALSPDGSSDLTAEQTQLQKLQLAVDSAESNYKDVNGKYADAVIQASDSPVEVTRVDTANVPTYPVSPVRYLYLLMGLLCGALAGAGLTYLTGGRRVIDLRHPSEDPYDEPTAQMPAVVTAPVAVTAPAEPMTGSVPGSVPLTNPYGPNGQGSSTP